MKIYRIIIHSSATAKDTDFTEQMLKIAHEARGINAPMGYHRYIRKSGRKVKGREFWEKGAHANPYNNDSIGICYEGGLKAGGRTWRDAEDTRTEDQKASLLDCIYEAIKYFQTTDPGEINKDYKIDIIGHGQLPGIKKECPCFDALSEYSWIIE